MFRSRTALIFCILSAMVGLLVVSSARAQVVISQIYSGGGTAGATYTNDYIELFNRGTAPVNLSTWSVQYAVGAGNGWWNTAGNRVNLTGTILPGGYYLIKGASSGAVGSTLPTPDTANTMVTDMATAGGKVALVASQTALPQQYFIATGVNSVVDLVTYGAATTGNYGFEGNGPTGTALTSSTAAFRLNDGCTDTNDNSVDFTTLAPFPRNSASPTHSCDGLDPSGACCLSNGTCQYLTAAACSAISGAAYTGDYIPCALGTYTVTSTPAALIDISTTGTNITGAGASDVVNPPLATPAFSLPFGVTYYGQTFSNFRADSNGWITLCQTYATSTSANVAFPPATATTPVCLLTPYWDDLTTASTTTGRIYSQTLGFAPTRQFIVQWDKMPWANSAVGGTAKNTFQLIFNESSQVIEFRYGSIVASGATYTGGSIQASFNAGFKDMSSRNGVNINPSDLGTGGAAAARQFTPTGQCPATGACCLNFGCFTATTVSCPAGGGAYSGDGTSCNPNPCAIGACCLPDGTCDTSQTVGQCSIGNGLYQGNGSVCGSCAPIGSCCVGAACSVGFESVCLSSSGVWSVGGNCSTNVCAGSCCDDTSHACALTTAANCPFGSTFAGAGTTCAISPCPAPSNDECWGAFILTPGSSVIGYNYTATDESPSPGICHFQNSYTAGVWYTFIAASSHRYSVSTCDSHTNFDTSVYVFTGACGALTCVDAAASDQPACTARADAATVGFCATAGTTYYVLVASNSAGAGGVGAFGLALTDLGDICPHNDTCATALPVVVGSTTPGSNVYALDDVPLGTGTTCNLLGAAYNRGVWYTFTEDSSTPRRLSANLCNPATDFDAEIAVFSGNSCDSLACVTGNWQSDVGCNNQNSGRVNLGSYVQTDIPNAFFCTTPGTTYYILVAGQGNVSGDFALNLVDTGEGCGAPANDTCSTARRVNAMPFEHVVFPQLAADDPLVSCSDPSNTVARAGVWYTYTPTQPGSFFFKQLPAGDPSGTGDTVITVYTTPTDCSALAAVACDTNQFGDTPITHMDAGTSYYVLVSAFSSTAPIQPLYDIRFSYTPDPGVCCRGATCSTAATQANCISGGALAGSVLVSASSTCNTSGITTHPCCYADYNKVHGITVQDIFDFLSDWFAGSKFAVVGGDGAHGTPQVQHIFDFLSAWFAGGCT